MLNTCIDFTLGDGTTVPLTLQFYALYKLQAEMCIRDSILRTS